MASNDAQTAPRRRTAADGRIVANVGSLYGGYICEEAERLGITPATVLKMLVVEAVKSRGITKATLEEKFGDQVPVAAVS